MKITQSDIIYVLFFTNFMLWFQAFYNCLTLEGGAQARPVKIEMAKELYQLLKSSIVNIGRDSVSVNSDQSDPHSSNTSLSDDFYSCKPSDLPNCLVELGEFLDNLGHEDPTFIVSIFF